jgi:hypothetical protein
MAGRDGDLAGFRGRGRGVASLDMFGLLVVAALRRGRDQHDCGLAEPGSTPRGLARGQPAALQVEPPGHAIAYRHERAAFVERQLLGLEHAVQVDPTLVNGAIEPGRLGISSAPMVRDGGQVQAKPPPARPRALASFARTPRSSLRVLAANERCFHGGARPFWATCARAATAVLLRAPPVPPQAGRQQHGPGWRQRRWCDDSELWLANELAAGEQLHSTPGRRQRRVRGAPAHKVVLLSRACGSGLLAGKMALLIREIEMQKGRAGPRSGRRRRADRPSAGRPVAAPTRASASPEAGPALALPGGHPLARHRSVHGRSRRAARAGRGRQGCMHCMRAGPHGRPKAARAGRPRPFPVARCQGVLYRRSSSSSSGSGTLAACLSSSSAWRCASSSMVASGGRSAGGATKVRLGCATSLRASHRKGFSKW